MDDATAAIVRQNAPKHQLTGGEETEWRSQSAEMRIVRRPMGKFGQDAKVTPLLFSKDILGFLMTTESQDLDLMSHPKDGAFCSIVSPSLYQGPTQTAGWAPPALTPLPAAT